MTTLAELSKRNVITTGTYEGISYQIIKRGKVYSGIILNSDGSENFETQRISAGYLLNTIGALKAATGFCKETIDTHVRQGRL